MSLPQPTTLLLTRLPSQPCSPAVPQLLLIRKLLSVQLSTTSVAIRPQVGFWAPVLTLVLCMEARSSQQGAAVAWQRL